MPLGCPGRQHGAGVGADEVTCLVEVHGAILSTAGKMGPWTVTTYAVGRVYERPGARPGPRAWRACSPRTRATCVSPWAEPVRGSRRSAEFWEAERDGPDEEFTMISEVVAVDGDTAVVRAHVDYGATGTGPGATSGCCDSAPTAGAVTSRSGRSHPTSRTDTETTGEQGSDELLEQTGVHVVQESADGDRVRDQRVGAHLANVVAQCGLLVLDHAEVLPGGVLAG